jgi:predicted short-subunit dehydrogenase-like oxidoreductase (DUF2520 family)
VGLGLALAQAGFGVRLHGRNKHDLPKPLESSWGETPSWISEIDVLLLAVPDGAVSSVARSLAETGRLREGQVVLHLSGLLDAGALEPARRVGCAVGSMHPLQSLSTPLAVPESLKGATAAIEGDAPAVAAAERLARALGLRPIRLSPGAKPLYHAAAVFGSNYIVVLAAAAQRLFELAGLSRDEALRALRVLLQGTVANIARQDPQAALTGPVARGDIATIQCHLAALPAEEAQLYCALATAALELTTITSDDRQAIESELESYREPVRGSRLGHQPERQS